MQFSIATDCMLPLLLLLTIVKESETDGLCLSYLPFNAMQMKEEIYSVLQ